jgi:hypothetical protein
MCTTRTDREGSGQQPSSPPPTMGKKLCVWLGNAPKDVFRKIAMVGV